MHLSACDSCQSLVLLCVLLRSCQAFRNDATELLFSRVTAPQPVPPEVQSNVTLNRARTGGRGATGGAHDRGGEDRRMLRLILRSYMYIGTCVL
ncbi:Sclerostin domain-containing protein 1 [Liparis tanakae]|uniref:Sclerostin domain-containing protein 1 n=1 Tax=Liparis tanakae TaxID=230148 RepID=A0A4Z2EG62_9TELE|nr:Sclerostin domain-containing protein 1 [Liparis tanakae]